MRKAKRHLIYGCWLDVCLCVYFLFALFRIRMKWHRCMRCVSSQTKYHQGWMKKSCIVSLFYSKFERQMFKGNTVKPSNSNNRHKFMYFHISFFCIPCAYHNAHFICLIHGTKYFLFCSRIRMLIQNKHSGIFFFVLNTGLRSFFRLIL